MDVYPGLLFPLEVVLIFSRNVSIACKASTSLAELFITFLIILLLSVGCVMMFLLSFLILVICVLFLSWSV